MSETQIACPNCSQSISITEAEAGRTVQCPTCKRQFTAPKPAVSVCPPPLPPSVRMGVSKPAPPPVIATTSIDLTSTGAPNDTSELERQILEGGRFVVFPYCISVLVLTFRRSSDLMFLRGDEDGARHALTYSLISFFAGWWGIPWGPIWTIASLFTNLSGGKDLTQAVLMQKFGPAGAAHIMAQRRKACPKGVGLKALQWGTAGVALLLLLAVMLPVFAGVIGSREADGRARQPGQAQFMAANRQIHTYHGSTGFGNSPEAVAVATRFSSNMKKMRELLFERGNSGGISLSQHEFLTCCELQETQCVLIVHVPELRRFSDSAKASLGTLAWFTAQQTLASEQVGKPGMKLAIGLRGAVLYDRVLTGSFNADSSPTNGPGNTITGVSPEKALYPWFQSETPARL